MYVYTRHNIPSGRQALSVFDSHNHNHSQSHSHRHNHYNARQPGIHGNSLLLFSGASKYRFHAPSFHTLNHPLTHVCVHINKYEIYGFMVSPNITVQLTRYV